MKEYRAAMRILSFCGHAYVWEVPDQPAATLPPQLAQPWHEVAQWLGRPPVLSYASYALDNWRRLDKTKPIQLDNIVLLQNFLGGLDEEWFVVVHIQIEREAGPGLAGLLRAMRGADEDKESEVLLGLKSLALAQTAMRDTLLRMQERCDPYVYYNRVRPYIHGWKNSSPTRAWSPMPASRSSFGARPGRKVLLCPVSMPGSESPMPQTL
jgi:indoleamine 2,3-dioxygenase